MRELLNGVERIVLFYGVCLSVTGNDGNLSSLRKQVFKLLDKNPLLTAKPMCALLKVSFELHGNYVKKLKADWKGTHKSEQGSKSPSVHCWRGFCSVVNINRVGVEAAGWARTRSRNRFLLWKDQIGRMEWFETGRVNLYVRKPGNLGKAYQLFCNGFFKTGLITDVKVLEETLKSVRFKSAHFVFETDRRLPKLQINLFDETNGVTIKVGDRSHPHAVEVVAEYMRQFELIDTFMQGLKLSTEKVGGFDLHRFGVV